MMKKIKKLNLSDIEAGSQYELFWRSGYEPISAVKVLGKKGNSIIIIESDRDALLGPLEIPFSGYYIFNNYKEALIARACLYSEWGYIHRHPERSCLERAELYDRLWFCYLQFGVYNSP